MKNLHSLGGFFAVEREKKRGFECIFRIRILLKLDLRLDEEKSQTKHKNIQQSNKKATEFFFPIVYGKMKITRKKSLRSAKKNFNFTIRKLFSCLLCLKTHFAFPRNSDERKRKLRAFFSMRELFNRLHTNTTSSFNHFRA